MDIVQARRELNTMLSKFKPFEYETSDYDKAHHRHTSGESIEQSQKRPIGATRDAMHSMPSELYLLVIDGKGMLITMAGDDQGLNFNDSRRISSMVRKMVENIAGAGNRLKQQYEHFRQDQLKYMGAFHQHPSSAFGSLGTASAGATERMYDSATDSIARTMDSQTVVRPPPSSTVHRNSTFGMEIEQSQIRPVIKSAIPELPERSQEAEIIYQFEAKTLVIHNFYSTDYSSITGSVNHMSSSRGETGGYGDGMQLHNVNRSRPPTVTLALVADNAKYEIGLLRIVAKKAIDILKPHVNVF